MKNAKQFSARNDVEASAPFGKPSQQIYVGVRLDGITHQMRDLCEGLVKNSNVSAERGFAVNVDGSADLIGNAIERNVFAMEPAGFIPEMVHGTL